MDLSVEAECFGAKIRISEDEVPTVIQPVLSPDLEEEERMAQAEAMPIPAVGAGRTGIYLDAIRKAVQMITDRPVFAGVIGPFLWRAACLMSRKPWFTATASRTWCIKSFARPLIS